MDKSARTFTVNIPGFTGSVVYRFMGYLDWKEWNQYVHKGQKRDLLNLKKSGIRVEKEEEVILTSAWASSLMIEEWNVFETEERQKVDAAGDPVFDGDKPVMEQVPGDAIPQPVPGFYPPDWSYGDDKEVPFQLYQWFRFTANEYIAGQISPNVKGQQG